MKSDWGKYFQNTKQNPPRRYLVKAIEYISNKDTALDLGAGAFNDVRYLLEQGFGHITAVDIEPIAKEEIELLPKDRITYVISSFEDFEFPKNTYDLINAQYSLPFNSPETFSIVFGKLKDSLKKDGIFVGQFFGLNDEWNKEGAKMTFLSKDEIVTLLSDMEIIELNEEEKEGKTAAGNEKHWHVFHVIAKK